ncbi:exopolysaccharide biosynthesis polyprenyl glycosylphosphotransferase [Halobacillus litoralis]|uniref:Exopolysaccharide biosynthesis polyprenyl glycosylphosphotransferase n=1 Tax=Halobacillus litoralis TaxID=45668 RepID=A0A845E354_9BACI|nr:exopolysaccharide biosynthesis polyprenyl glycosylphosphotransferase [Halobacillus litoralis]
MNQSFKGNFTPFIFIDMALLFCGFWIIYHFFGARSIIDFPFHTASLPLALGIAYMIFTFSNSYKNWERKSLKDLMYSVVFSMTIVGVCISLGIVFTSWFTFGISYLMVSISLQTFLLLLVRSLAWSFIRKRAVKRIWLIGDEDSKMDHFLENNEDWYRICGSSQTIDEDVLKEYGKDTDALLIGSGFSAKEKVEMVQLATKYGKETLVIPELYELGIQGAETYQLEDTIVFSIQPFHIHPIHQLLKRGMDVIGSLSLILLTSPILLLLAGLIPLTSPGPALYKQQRLGIKGKPFWIYKFRSMVADAENKTGPVLATFKDPRITTIGSFIRATRLDELPQLFNVLKGEMSLIGPRPEREYFVKQFNKQFPDYHHRLEVKPGITGLAQVHAKYTTSAEDKLRFDLAYVKNYSLSSDWKILILTLKVVFHREQAQGVDMQGSMKSVGKKRAIH